MIAVIDYDAGNASSVINALRFMGYQAKLVTTPKELSPLKNISLIILPGVGSADATKTSLTKLCFWQELPHYVLEQKTPFLGICVGLQILFEHSEEGDTDCLGWLKGKVKRFDSAKVRVPQMGWNAVHYHKSSLADKPSLVTLADEPPPYFYFVNSYYAIPTHTEVIGGHAHYQTDFCAIANAGNIIATQFHLEKSGEAGLHLFRKILTHFEIQY